MASHHNPPPAFGQTPPPAVGSILQPLQALFAATGLLFAGQGLLVTLLPVRLRVEDFSSAIVSIVGASYSLGFALGAWRCAPITRRVGQIRAFGGFAAALVVITLVLPLKAQPGVWSPLRFLYGFFAAGAVMAIESWLNGAASPQSRGQVLAAYTFVAYLAFGGGQFLLPTHDVAGFELFAIGAMLLAASIIPVALSRIEAPLVETASLYSPRRLLQATPLGALGSLGSGLVWGAFYALGPLFAEQVSSTTTQIALVMATTILGGLLVQWPVGYLSDRFNRRTVINAVALSAAAVSGVIAVAGEHSLGLLLLLLALFGGASIALYPLCLAHAADFLVPGEDMLSVSSAVLAIYGAGAAVGPIVAGQAFEAQGGSGLFVFCAAALSAVALVGLWEVRRQRPAPREEQGPYVAVPESTAVLFELHPQALVEQPQLEFEATETGSSQVESAGEEGPSNGSP